MPVLRVNHPNMPYDINASCSYGPMCSIKMDNMIFRVVHIHTGLAIQEFRNRKDSMTFMKRIGKYQTVRKYLHMLTWEFFKEGKEARENFEYILNKNLHDLDVASDKQATECRYYNKPIFVDTI